MKIAFDTNVILDALVHRDGWENAEKLMMAVAEERIGGVISANTLTDIYYIVRKRLGDQNTRVAIWNLMSVFDISSVDSHVCLDALSIPMNDYEDAVLAVSVRAEGAEYIVTRDESFLASEASPVETVTPQMALEFIGC